MPRLGPGHAKEAMTRRLIAIMAVALLLFTYGLGVGTLWDQDEAKYTEIATEILRTGDPITLHYNGQPWFVHPPLFMWLQALTGRLFGFTEFTARVWSAISGAVVAVETFLLAALFYDRRTATLAAAILATTLQFLAQARLAVFDPTLLAFMLAAFYMGLVGQTSGRRGPQLWAWVWAGLATLTKGPIGLALPALILLLLGILRGEWRRWRPTIFIGPLLCAAIALPWYVIETSRHGEAFLQSVVGYYLLTRFFGVVENQSGPWWYYLPVLAVGTFPWSAFLPAMTIYHLRRRGTLASQAILSWIGVTVLIYSLAGTKLPNYVLPVYPLVAIGIARLSLEGLDGASADAPRLLRGAFALMLVGVGLALSGVAAFGFVEYPSAVSALRTALGLVAAVFLAGPVTAMVLHRLGRTAAALGALIAMMAIAVPVLVHHTLPAVETLRPIPRLARTLREQMLPGDSLVAVRQPLAASLIYYTQRQVIWIDEPSELSAAICRHARLFLFIPESAYREWVAPMLPPAARLQGEDGGYRIVLKDEPGPCIGSHVLSPAVTTR